MPDDRPRFFSGSPTRTIIQLVIASVIVGAIFSLIGVSPKEFWRGIFDTFRGLVEMLGESIGEIAVNLLPYLLIGAAIVVPIWLIARLIQGRK